MNSDQKFLIRFWSIFLPSIVIIAISLMLTTRLHWMEEDRLVADLVASGASPWAAHCAITGGGNNDLCGLYEILESNK